MDRNRRHVRHLITPRLYVAMNGSSAGGILYDVSPGGLSLDVVGPKPPGERVLLDFEMPETGEHFAGSGRIIWQKDPGSRVGIQFIDLPETSHLKIRSWISARSISTASLQNMMVRDRSDATFRESPASPRERATSPANSPATSAVSSAVLESTANQRPMVSAPAGTPAPLKPPPAPLPQQQSNATLPHVDERGVQGLRSLFSQHEPLEPQPAFADPMENNPPNWRQVRQWLLVAGVVLLALMFLATTIKIFSSPEFNAGTTYQVVKSKLASAVAKFMESPASQRAAQSRVSSLNAQPNLEPKKPPVSHEPRPAIAPSANNTDANKTGAAKAPATDDRFEVTDALHGRRYLPRTSTNLVVQFQRPGGFKQADDSANGNAAADGAVLPDNASASHSGATTSNLLAPVSANSPFGRVLRESSGERPVMEAMPDYPQIALQQNVQGRVVLTAVIATDGTLEDVRILSAPSLLDAPVLGAVKTWRYQPHFRDGQAVEVVTEIVVDFSITTK